MEMGATGLEFGDSRRYRTEKKEKKMARKNKRDK